MKKREQKELEYKAGFVDVGGEKKETAIFLRELLEEHQTTKTGKNGRTK